MIAINRRTMTYRYDKNYLVDIVTTTDDYEAWLSRAGYGHKHFLFGMPKSQQSYFEFFEIVQDSVEDYIDLCYAQDNWLEMME